MKSTTENQKGTEMDRMTIRMTDNRKLIYGTRSVGPTHDPYHREYVRLETTREGLEWVLVSCGLAGLYVEVWGSKSSLWGLPLDQPRHVWQEEKAERWMIEHTGFGSDFWLRKVWERRDRAAFRRDPEAFALRMELEEADAAMLRNAL